MATFNHTNLKTIAKLNPGLRWQFRALKSGKKPYWQALPPNKVPTWWTYTEYRVKPGQDVRVKAGKQAAVLDGATGKVRTVPLDTTAEMLADFKKNPLPATQAKADAWTTLGAGLDHPQADAILLDIIDAMKGIDVGEEVTQFFEALCFMVRDDLTRREADRIVRAIAATINKTR